MTMHEMKCCVIQLDQISQKLIGNTYSMRAFDAAFFVKNNKNQ